MCKVICLDFWDTIYSNDNSAERHQYIQSYISEKFVIPQETVKSLLEKYNYLNRDKQISLLDRLTYIENMLQIKISDEKKKEAEKNISASVLKFPPQLFEGVSEFLSKISLENKVFLVSNTNYSYGYDLKKILQKDGLFDYFDDFFFSDELKMRKTNDLLFEHIIKKHNLLKNQNYFIGDSERNDIIPALKHDFYCIKKCSKRNINKETLAQYKFLEYNELFRFFEDRGVI